MFLSQNIDLNNNKEGTSQLYLNGETRITDNSLQ